MAKCKDCKNYEYIGCINCGFCNGWKKPKRIVHDDENIDAPCTKYKQEGSDTDE